MKFIKPEEILEATRGGLDIILDLYPGAHSCVDFPSRKFKLRSTEKSASASLKLLEDGNWVVTDFGGDQKPRNGILCYQFETAYDYGRTLQELALKYSVFTEEEKKNVLKPDYQERDATPDEVDGTWEFNTREQGEIWKDYELLTLFSKYSLEYLGWHKEATKQEAYSKLAGVLKLFRYHPVVSYTVISKRKVRTFSATDHYPIFLIDEGKFKKLYQPKHYDAGRRFTYHGDYIKNYIHGLEQAQKERARLVKKAEDAYDPLAEGKQNTEPKLSEIILCTGGSDALNIAVFGYWVIWMNSETAKLYKNQYDDILKIADTFYNLPDIDATGKRTAHELAMQYLDLKTIELPEELQHMQDRRGKPCKDVRDFLNHFDFWKLRDRITQAKEYRFWDRVPIWEGKKDEKYISGYQYKFRNVRAYNFLFKNGFSRFKTPGKKNSYTYIRIEGNQVREVEPSDVKDFITGFLEDRNMEEELRDFMYNTTKLNDTSISNLMYREIDFNDFDQDTQYLFFKNQTWKVTGSGIEKFKPGEVHKYIWEDDMVPHRVDLKEAPFTITKNEDTEEYKIVIHDEKCLFLRYLVQTSRIHWRKELEEQLKGKKKAEEDAYIAANKFNIAGPNLNAEEIAEQELHLINKIFTIGYLLHRYKDASRAYFVFAMDNKINDDGGSYGGSGKSLLFNLAITQVLRKNLYLGGRNPKLTDNPFIYDGLTEHHRYVLIDDADEYLNLKFFFDAATGNIKVNPKNSQAYTIPFEKTGKFALSSNFTPRDIDPSTERRLLYTVFSDYYHNHGEVDDYNETRRVSDDFGKNLFYHFDDSEFDLFFNTMAYCLRFYLSNNAKIGPPMSNVSKRNLISVMGQDFFGWADVYFAEESGNLDKCIVKEEAFDDYRIRFKSVWKMQRFTKAIKAWTKYWDFSYNPKDLLNSQGRIIRKIKDRRKDKDGNWITLEVKVSKEMMYIQTKPGPLNDIDDLPF